jgi:hypothetical protein
MAALAVAAGILVGASIAVLRAPSTAGATSSQGLRASFQTVSTWSGGYTANFTITNPGPAAVNGWTLTFTLPSGATMVNSWNGTASISGNVVSVTNASWNGSLGSGASANFGFQVAYSGVYAPPGACTINGVANCTGTSASTGGGSAGGGSTGGGSTGGGSTGGGSGSGSAPMSAALAVGSDWGAGYTATFTITNTGTTTTTTWTVLFPVPSGGTLSSYWNAVGSQSAGQETFTPVAWNGTLAPGATASVGFEIDGTDVKPARCSINGSTSSCTVPPATSSGSGSGAGSGSASGSGTGSTCSKIPGTAGTVPYAPYTDVTLYPQINLTATACASGIRDYTLAFFQGTPSGAGCTPELAGASYQNGALQTDIASLRTLGGDVIGSFGGEAGQELAQTCANVSQLEGAYQSVVDYYGLTQIDFDIEGAAVSQASSIAERSQAMAALQKTEAAKGVQLGISLTLPVLPQGLPSAELNVVQSAVNAGVSISVVNVMAMDYGDGPAPNPSGLMGTYAIDAAQATASQLATIFPKASTAQLRSMVGVTPMLGQNDASDEIFTVADASRLAAWAKSQGIGRLAAWSTARDVECPGGADQTSDVCSGVVQAPWAFAVAFEGA